jgi:macrolide transport system ATP-binding/permease protein
MNLKRLLKRLRDPRRAEADLHEEVESFYETMAERRVDGGVAPDEARRMTCAEYGPPVRVREEVRESRPEAVVENFVHDFRYGLRMLRKNPGFAAVAVFTLALGIGANTAIYSLMESILMRSLPVANPEGLVVLNWQSPPPHNANKEWVHVVHGIQGRFWPGGKGVLASGIFPYPALEMLREESRAFTTLFGYFDGHARTLVMDGQATSAGTEFVTGEYFQGLGVSPAAGRLIGSQDDRPGAPAVAVLSFAASQSRFGGPSNAVGKSILIDNVPFTIVGVTPPEFFGVDPSRSPDVYLPVHTNLLVDGPEAGRLYHDQNFYWLEMMGRLRPGVGMAQAQAMLAPRFHRWVQSTATTDGECAKLPQLVLNPGASGLASLRRQYSKPLSVLLAMVALILALVCANLANLLLARSAARRREIAVRLSLGAGRLRVVRQLLTESLLVASMGGALGVLFAIWGVRMLTILFSNGRENFTLHAQLNWKVLVFTAALSVLCGLLFGLAPALQATHPEVMPALKNGSGGAPRRRVQHFLVVAQIAMSFLILVAAGLFVQTLSNLHSVPLGYGRENLLLFSVNARQAGHRDPEITNFYAELRKRLESIPGVRNATFSHASLISAGHAGATYRGPVKIGHASVEGVNVVQAGPRFLTTMQIPIVAGREIDDRDRAGSAPVAVISEQLARTYFPNESPLGRRITFVGWKRDLEIVGVSGNVRTGGLKNDGTSLTVFAAASQSAPEGLTFALRTEGDPLALVSSVQQMVREADSRIPITNIATQAAEIDRTISREITFAKLCSAFAVLALLIACVGLYGTTSYTVARRVSEIGIRMALGAESRTVVAMVLRQVLLWIVLGLAISLPAAALGFRWVQSFLFGIRATDPGTFVLAAATLIGAAMAAAYLPARRASRIDPLVALRHE